MVCLLFLLLVGVITTLASKPEPLSAQALIDEINSKQSLWKAGPTGKLNSRSDVMKNDVSWRPKSKSKPSGIAESQFLDIDIPKEFDARKQWPQCPSISSIRDQSSCGSCWAFGAVEAMSDRLCIASNGSIQVTLSADDLISCCGGSCSDGCDGGSPIYAWMYWESDGIVTGSNKSANAGCRPYPFDPCEHHNNKTHYKPCPKGLYPTPKCEKKCQEGYDKTYDADKYYAKSSYFVHSDPVAIQKEVMTNGPVEVSFEVFADFDVYQSGIYVHTTGESMGGHAVKLLGWGEENGTPYWLVANSWNQDWGENGFFRIIRGQDECGIETGAVAGLPRID